MESLIEKTHSSENLSPAFAEAASRRQVTPFCLSKDRKRITKEGNSSLLPREGRRDLISGTYIIMD
jgi:hypothetical protein